MQMIRRVRSSSRCSTRLRRSSCRIGRSVLDIGYGAPGRQRCSDVTPSDTGCVADSSSGRPSAAVAWRRPPSAASSSSLRVALLGDRVLELAHARAELAAERRAGAWGRRSGGRSRARSVARGVRRSGRRRGSWTWSQPFLRTAKRSGSFARGTGRLVHSTPEWTDGPVKERHRVPDVGARPHLALMSQPSDNSHYVRRVVLPSGREIEVVYFDAQAAPAEAEADRLEPAARPA